MSPHHLQRRFKALVGVSPREYQAACRADRLRASLRRGDDVTTAIYEAGYGSPSRVYEGGAARGMAPSAYRKRRRRHAAWPTPWSPARSDGCWSATTANGVCAVKLGTRTRRSPRTSRGISPRPTSVRASRPAPSGSGPSSSTFGAKHPRWTCRSTCGPRRSSGRCGGRCRRFRTGETSPTPKWRAPSAGRRAVRAVARACATNPVAIVVPCHRVVQTGGGLGGYRWGVERKKRLLAQEHERVAEREAC